MLALLPVPHGDVVLRRLVNGNEVIATVGLGERQAAYRTVELAAADNARRHEAHRVPNSYVRLMRKSIILIYKHQSLLYICIWLKANH